MTLAESYIQEAIARLNMARTSDSYVALPQIVKASVVVALNELSNQCDGCRRGLPVVDGIHRGEPYDLQSCTKHRYRLPVLP